MRSSKCFQLSLAVAILFATSVVAVALPVANYDAGTGNITFVLDEPVIGLDFKSSTGALIASNGDQLGAGTTFDTSLSPNVLSWFNFGTLSGTLDAGNIVTPGTDVGTLEFGFLRGFGQPVVPGEIIGGVTPTPVAVGDPADGTLIDLYPEVLDGTGARANAIVLSNAGDGTLEISNLSVSGADASLFGANNNGLNIDLTFDIAGTGTNPPRSYDASLLVETNGGNLSYPLTAFVPEPTTMMMAGLGLIGMFCGRRR